MRYKKGVERAIKGVGVRGRCFCGRLAVVVLAALVSASCAGSVEIPAEDGFAPAAAPPPAPAGGSLPDGVTVTIGPDDPDVSRSIERAGLLVAGLGSDEAASDAALLAFEAGYSSRQVLDAAGAGALGADGLIPGVTPESAPLGLIRPSIQDDRVLVEILRESAQEFAGPGDLFPTGFAGTTFILLLAMKGVTPQQIYEILLFGEYEYETGGRCFRRLIDVDAEGLRASSVERPCDPAPPAAAPEPPAEEPVADPPVPEPGQVAVYVGQVPDTVLDNESSEIRLTLSDAGEVGGTLALRERLEQGVANIDGGCPATVDWSADLASLSFSGSEAYTGEIAGTIQITWLTTEDPSCGGTSTETFDLELTGTATPDRVEVSAPFSLTLTRQT